MITDQKLLEGENAVLRQQVAELQQAIEQLSQELLALRQSSPPHNDTSPTPPYPERLLPESRLIRMNHALKKEVEKNRLTEEKLQMTQYSLDHAADGVAWYDPDGNHLYVNDAACQYPGFSREELLARTVFDLNPNLTRETWRTRWQAIKEQGSVTYETQHHRKDGTTFPVEVTMNYLEFNGKEYLCSFIRNITERKRAEQELRASEQKYRMLFDSEIDAISLVDIETRRILDTNPAWHSLYGYTPEEATSMHITDISAEPDESGAALDYLFQNHSGFIPLRWHKNKDGRTFPVELSAGVFTWNERSVVCIVARDITERRQTEMALRKLNRAVEQSPTSIVITDTDGTIEYVNPKFTEVTGYTAEEAMGENPRVLKSGTMPSEGYRELWQTILAGKEWRGEFHNRRKNGEYFWESASISPITNEHGTITHLIAVKEDITERKQAEAALHSNLEFLSTLINTIPSPVFYKDTEGRYLGCNQLFAQQIRGMSKDDIIGQSLLDLSQPLPDGERSTFYQEDLELLRNPGTRSFEVTINCADGIQRDFVLNRTTFLDNAGRVAGIVGVMWDITERKHMETELRTAYQTLKSLNERLQQELNLARTIQQSLLPPPDPYWSGLEVVCYNAPAQEVGGDLYTYNLFRLPSRNDPMARYGLAVGDVSGKGMPAALLMAVSLALFHSVVRQELSPAALLSYLDDSLVHYTRTTRQNCAMVYIEVRTHHPTVVAPVPTHHTTHGVVRVANAGCIAPIIKRYDGTIQWLDVGGLPLGIGLGATFGYQEASLELAQGDMIILLSDGMLEAHNAEGDIFGFPRMEAAIRSGPHHSVQAMLDHLRGALEQFMGEMELNDDVTLVIIRV